MKKIIVLLMAIAMFASLMAGCVGTTVVIGNCTCPTGGGSSNQPTEGSKPTEGMNPTPVAEEIKTGLAVMTDISGSKQGQAKFEVTYAAVALDKDGKIVDCIIDGINTTVKFDETGAITTDLTAPVQTKNELGDKYNMVAYGGAKAEWYKQAEAFASYVIGKTVDEVKGIAVNEATKPAEGTDLAASVTISVGGFISAVEKAAANAENRGAKRGDELILAVMPGVGSSKNAGEKNGTAQLDADVTVLTRKDGVITSCYIDSLQAKVSFDATGAITTDLTAPVQTKNELGDKYNMVAYGGAKAEWYKQAEAFANYTVGKTASEVAGIAISESTKPAEGTDLAASVTISIAGFMALIAKAMQ